MIVTTVDFRNGLIIDYESQPYQILWFQNHKTAMSGAIMRVKIKNLNTGSILERTFKNSDKFKEYIASKRKMQFLYIEGEDFNFMDMQSFEQMALPKAKLGEESKFLVENMEVEALYIDEKFMSIQLPASVEMKVSSTVPGVKGDSVSNMMKPATTETGIEVQVPLFIKENDRIRVDTRSGEYLERV